MNQDEGQDKIKLFDVSPQANFIVANINNYIHIRILNQVD